SLPPSMIIRRECGLTNFSPGSGSLQDAHRFSALRDGRHPLFLFPLCSFASFVVKGFSDHPILASLCLHPAARPPPPIHALLQTKTKVTFDRAVDRTVEPLFLVQSVFNLTEC